VNSSGDGKEEASTIDEEPALPRSRRGAARVVTVLSGKAGVGKSTVAANLACAIARGNELSTAVFDLSLQFGDQGLMFDAGPSPSLVDVLANIDALTTDFLLDCMHSGAGNVRILAAPPSPELADLVLPEHFRTVLDELEEVFDVVVIDTTSHLSDITLEAIERSDVLILVTTPYLASVKDTKLLLKVLSDLGVPARKINAIVNRLEPGIKVSLEVLEANLKFPLSLELPHVQNSLIDSVTDGIPLVLSRPGSDWAQRVNVLADLAIKGGAETARKAARKTFLGLTRP
jgi:pilus assembly protein CpaE